MEAGLITARSQPVFARSPKNRPGDGPACLTVGRFLPVDLQPKVTRGAAFPPPIIFNSAGGSLAWHFRNSENATLPGSSEWYTVLKIPFERAFFAGARIFFAETAG